MAPRSRPVGRAPSCLVLRWLKTVVNGTPIWSSEQGVLPPRPGHEPLSGQRLATGGGTTRPVLRRPRRRTGLDGGHGGRGG